MCGDSSYGHEGLLAECEARSEVSLPAASKRRRQTTGANPRTGGGWQPAVNGWEGLEGRLQLTGWTAKRRVVVLRRKVERKTERESPRELGWPMLAQCGPAPEYEYQVLVTNLSEEILSLTDLYRQRADAENVYDELKNQWGWGGFMTKDMLRCQVAARNVALIYNWWSLFVRCAEPERPREAVTSRPLLLCAVGRVIESGRQWFFAVLSGRKLSAADVTPSPRRTGREFHELKVRALKP